MNLVIANLLPGNAFTVGALELVVMVAGIVMRMNVHCAITTVRLIAAILTICTEKRREGPQQMEGFFFMKSLSPLFLYDKPTFGTVTSKIGPNAFTIVASKLRRLATVRTVKLIFAVRAIAVSITPFYQLQAHRSIRFALEKLFVAHGIEAILTVRFVGKVTAVVVAITPK